MAITIDSQPRTECPNPVSHPIQWDLLTTDHINTNGDFASFQVTFNATGSSDGDTFTLLGQTFSVDESTPFTDTTFNYTGTVENAASNFANMLRSNFLFAEWDIYTSSGGGTATATAVKQDVGVVPNFTFDYSGLTTALSANVETQGIDTVLNDYTLWYQLWVDGAALGEIKFGRVPYDVNNPGLPAKFDLKKTLKGLVDTVFPLWTLNAPSVDSNFHRQVYLRFGGITKDADGNDINLQSYQSSVSWFVNSVFQLREINEFKNHCPAYTNTVRFLTDRDENTPVPLDSYEWVWIYIARSPTFTGEFRVRYVFDYGSGVTVDLVQNLPTYILPDVYCVPIGTGAPHILPYMGDCESITITVEAEGSGGWINYSNSLVRHIVRGSCFRQEVYFLEDKGSWGTAFFEEIEEAQLLVEATTIETPLDWTSKNSNVFDKGGRTNVLQRAQEKCFLLSPKMPRDGVLARYFAMLMRSPTHYVRTTKLGINPIQDRRRIIIDRENSQIFKRGEITRFVLAYQFTTDKILQ